MLVALLVDVLPAATVLAILPPAPAEVTVIPVPPSLVSTLPVGLMPSVVLLVPPASVALAVSALATAGCVE